MTSFLLSEEDLRERLSGRLSLLDGTANTRRSDFDLNPQWRDTIAPTRPLAPAAVLVPIIERPDGMQVLFTRRADHLQAHAGQVSFPGGKVQDGDKDAVATALRETEEEVGLPREFITVFGALDSYETGTGFTIRPFVGYVREGFVLHPDPSEVAEAFEVPLRFLMDPENHERRSATWQGRERRFYAINYGGYYIWGATAGMLVGLYERLYGDVRA